MSTASNTNLRSTASNATFALLLALPGGIGIGTVSTAPSLVETPGLYSPWIQLPAAKTTPSSRVQAAARELASMTNWSRRKIATLLEVTHPTVTALIEGRSTGSNSDTANRVIDAHGVVKRIHALVGGDVTETVRVLESTPAAGTNSPAQLLAQGQPSDALLAALDVLNPPQPAGSMMTGLWPLRVGAGTHDPSEASSAQRSGRAELVRPRLAPRKSGRRTIRRDLP